MFMDFVNQVASAFVGFCLWLLVFPLRLLIGVLDPVFSPITAMIDFTGFYVQLDLLRGFFSDVNYFVPFGVAVGLFGSTVVVAFVLFLLNRVGYDVVGIFVGFGTRTLWHVVEYAADTVHIWAARIVRFLFG